MTQWLRVVTRIVIENSDELFLSFIIKYESRLTEDMKRELDRTKKTALVIKDVMNSIKDDIKLAMETDGITWDRVNYKYFQKRGSSKFLLRDHSAMSKNLKEASLKQEQIRMF